MCYRQLSANICVKTVLVCLLYTVAGPLLAATTPTEASKLGFEGTELTPVGAERAGNAEGTIPAWSGGLKEIPGHTPGGWYDEDPYGDDEVLFTITKANYKQYEDKLTDGQIYLLNKYDDYRMHVYPTHRSARMPKEQYELTMANATTAELCPEKERCMQGTADGGGFPFPIPSHGPVPSTGQGDKMGYEIVWNTYVRYIGDLFISPHTNIYIVNPDGKIFPTYINDVRLYPYSIPTSRLNDAVVLQPSKRGKMTQCLMLETVAPPRSAGTIISGCAATLDSTLALYLYIPGQRRVRKAPELGLHDAPGGNTDGLRMIDQFAAYFPSGGDERYDIKVHGKQEMYVAYNTYALANSGVAAEDFLHGKHPNQDLIRYELHRVWKLEMTLRDGNRHLSPRRTVYFDEDTWAGTWSDVWNSRGELWRAVEMYPIQWTDVPMFREWGQVFYDFPSERYVTSNDWWNLSPTAVMPTAYGPVDLKDVTDVDFEIFTPIGLRKMGRR